MRLDRFRTILETFLRAPQPYRNLYVWHGEVEGTDGLRSLLPSDQMQSLDLFQMTGGLSHHPFARDEVSELLRDALRARLRDWYTDDVSTQSVLVVTGCELLARYGVGLQPFYEALTDRGMIILVCSAADAAYDPAGRLPVYVRCEPGATLAYLSRLVEDDHVVEAVEATGTT